MHLIFAIVLKIITCIHTMRTYGSYQIFALWMQRVKTSTILHAYSKVLGWYGINPVVSEYLKGVLKPI